MLSTLFRTVVLVAVGVLCLPGCRKEEPAAKTMAEYETEARQEIGKDNFLSELDAIEKSVEEDIAREP
jgi:hypothetical protein